MLHYILQQKSKQTLMQQQPHKRSHRSAQRHRINSGVSGGSGTTGTSSDCCVRWQVNSNEANVYEFCLLYVNLFKICK